MVGRRVLRYLLLAVTTLVVGPVAVNAATGGSLPGPLRPYEAWTWPVIAATVLVTVWLWAREGPGEALAAVRDRPVPDRPDDPRNRTFALDRVAGHVDGRLAAALDRPVRLALALDDAPDAAAPSRAAVAPLLAPAGGGPGGSGLGAIGAVFDRSAQSLVLLGEPGAGKTTLLLQLAQELVGRARADPTAPVPVIVDLAAWRGPPRGVDAVDTWLLPAVEQRYGIPVAVAGRWLADGRLGLLLDGLDECAESERADCVAFLTGLGERLPVRQFALTCRIAEYRGLVRPVAAHAAVTVRPLSGPQVRGYLDAVDATGAASAALAADPELAALATSPLMLGVLAVTYADGAAGDGAPRDRLLDSYVVEQLGRRVPPAWSTEAFLHAVATAASAGFEHGGATVPPPRARDAWHLATTSSPPPDGVETLRAAVLLPGVMAGVVGAGAAITGLTAGVPAGLVAGCWAGLLAAVAWRGVGAVGALPGVARAAVAGAVAVGLGAAVTAVAAVLAGPGGAGVVVGLLLGAAGGWLEPEPGARRSGWAPEVAVRVAGPLAAGVVGAGVAALLGASGGPPPVGATLAFLAGSTAGAVAGLAVALHVPAFAFGPVLRAAGAPVPWSRPLLRHAADRQLVTEAGGEFRFVHELLQRHLVLADVRALAVAVDRRAAARAAAGGPPRTGGAG